MKKNVEASTCAKEVITVLTTDIRNFTFHSSPKPYIETSLEDFHENFEKLCVIVAEFHDITLDIAKKYDNEKEAVVLSTGDGIIIGFQNQFHADSAVETAIALQKKYKSFFYEANKTIGEKRTKAKLSFGIGIHTGKTIVKRYKSYHVPDHSNSLILGEAVNVSVRIEGITKEHPEAKILFSKETLDNLKNKKLTQNKIDFHIHNIRGAGELHLYGLPTIE